MTESVFQSTAAFRERFDRGLLSLLEHDGLGPFILVCANATFDPKIYAGATSRLQQRYRQLQADYSAALAEGRPLTDSDEDLLVFLKMLAVGFERLEPTEARHSGPWELQYNHLRAFRPQRISAATVDGIRTPFKEEGFHFNKGFLQKEAFWEGALEGREVALYYNKYPFVECHGLLVPEREKRLPQFLTEEYHHYLWRLSAALGESLPGVGFGYNAYGAFASVNHLHFQMFIREQPLPVADPRWRHNGGEHAYPTDCRCFEDAEEAWRFLEQLHNGEISYNLVQLPGRMYVMARRKQGSYTQPQLTTGFTWYELSGGVITFNRHDYQGLDPDTIARELAQLRIG